MLTIYVLADGFEENVIDVFDDFDLAVDKAFELLHNSKWDKVDCYDNSIAQWNIRDWDTNKLLFTIKAFELKTKSAVYYTTLGKLEDEMVCFNPYHNDNEDWR